MGICYTLIMEDEWDWGYSDTSKEKKLKEFEEKFGRYIEKIAEWNHFVVYDIDKASPYMEDRKDLIREYCDRAYYYDDLGSPIQRLDLPFNKPSVQIEIDRMENARTPEEKKAAEAVVLNKIKTDPKYTKMLEG